MPTIRVELRALGNMWTKNKGDPRLAQDRLYLGEIEIRIRALTACRSHLGLRKKKGKTFQVSQLRLQSREQWQSCH